MADHPKDAYEFTLVISEKGGAERRQVFRAGEVTLGRVPGNDIVLAKGNVSKKHARLLYREGRLIVTDLNSTNGTFVNRRKIAQATILRPEDRLFIGDYVLRVEAPVPGADSVGIDTTDRLTAPPLPGPVLRMAPEGEAHLVTLPPSMERTSDVGRRTTSSGPPSRRHEPPEPSGRQFEASAQRAVTARVLREVRGSRDVPLVVSESESLLLSEHVATVVDQLLVDGQIPVGTNGESVHDAAALELLGLGPLGPLLEDPNVSAVSAYRFDDLVETRDGRVQASASSFSCPEALELAVLRLLHELGLDPDKPSAIQRGALTRGDRHFSAQFSKLSSGWIFALERTDLAPLSVDELVRRGTLSRAMASFLGMAMQARLNLLVVSPLPSDAKAIAAMLLQLGGKERLLWLGNEADPSQGRAVPLSLPEEASARRETLEMVSGLPLTRIAFEAAPLVPWPSVLERGTRGAASLLGVAAGPRLGRVLEQLPLDISRSNPEVPLSVATSWVAGAFDLAVEASRPGDGRLRITRIAELHPGLELQDIFTFQGQRLLPGGTLEGNFAPSSSVPRVTQLLMAAGLRPDAVLFSRGSDPGERT